MKAFKISLLFILAMLQETESYSQTSFCSEDPPINPWLADSPYPIYHRNSYAQASTCLTSFLEGDSVNIKVRTEITGGTSPWIYLTDTYENGERCILYSNSNFVFKLIDDGEEIIAIDSIQIDSDFVSTFGYNHLLSRDHIWFSYDPAYDPENDEYTKIFKFTDEDISDPYSDIVLLDTFDFQTLNVPAVNMYNLNYNGEIVWYSEKDSTSTFAYAGVIDQEFNSLDTLAFEVLPGERVNHNSISVDEFNNFYIVTSHRLIQFSWDNEQVQIGWQAEYDFVADGPTGNFAYGSGTTPTLMGWGEGNDQLVVVADGHSTNNLVAFWRELPEGWIPVEGQATHFADSISIPNAQSFSNLFQSIENSPTIHGYDIAIAQFNGFLGYDCDNLKGVSKFSWDTELNQLELDWVNDDVNINGVLAYSSGSDLVYGTGKEEDCFYHYYGLNWQNGEIELDILLDQEGTFLNDPFYDAGVNNIIDEDGSIYFSGGNSLVKLERAETDVGFVEVTSIQFGVFPNPAYDELRIDGLIGEAYYKIYTSSGIEVQSGITVNSSINIKDLEKGLMILHIQTEDQPYMTKVVKL